MYGEPLRPRDACNLRPGFWREPTTCRFPTIPVTKTLDIGTTYRESSDDVPVHHGEVSPHSMLLAIPARAAVQ